MSNLEGELNRVLNQYASEVAEMTAEQVKEIAKTCQKDIKKRAPYKSGKYAKGWTVTVQDRRGVAVAVVYNKKAPGLAHLLENGHAKVGGGRVEGHPHIAPAVENAEKNLIKAIEGGIK